MNFKTYIRLITIVLAFTFCTIPNVQYAHAQAEGSAMHANLESIKLIDFIKFVGKYTGRNIVFNKGKIPGTNISVYAGQSLTEPELMAVFQQVLSNAGLKAVTRDNVTYIMPVREARTINPEVTTFSQKGSSEEVITTIFQLKGTFPPAKVVPILKPFASQIGQISPIPMADAVLVKDLKANISQMHKLLKMIKDIDSKKVIRTISLEKSSANVVSEKLTSFYKKMVATGRAGVPPVVEPIGWANSILVSGTKEQVSAIKSLITRLDKESESFSKLKVYKMHNIEAVVAADVLKSLLLGSTVNSSAKSGAKNSTPTNDSKIQVSADSTTNSLIVMASAEDLPKIDNFVEQLDIAQDQVYIEALVLETSLNNAKDFGVEWMAGIKAGGSVVTVGFSKGKDSKLPAYAKDPSSAAAVGGFSTGVLGDTITYAGKSIPSVAALVNFTRTSTDFNLISAPQIMTVENSEAEVFVGENRPYQTGAKSSGGGDAVVSTYQYKDVGIKLKVKPHINKEDGLVKLEVEQTYSTFSKTATANDTLPVTLDRKTKTTVMLADGATMVIGGLIQSDQNNSRSSIPYLSEIPLLGWLFKTETASGSKKTLMVFISAKIIKTTEEIEAISQAKMAKYKAQRARFNDFIDKEFNGGKNSQKKEKQNKSK